MGRLNQGKRTRFENLILQGNWLLMRDEPLSVILYVCFIKILQMIKRFTLLILLFSHALYAQYSYEPSAENPFGKRNPTAHERLDDFGQFIGEYTCISEARNANQEWLEPEEITWKWKYIMNGNAVQDETLKPDGSHSGSIRVFDADSLTWRVHYYTNKATPSVLSAWSGGVEGQDIVLYKKQVAPNGAPGFYRLTFSEISQEGFEWIGEWVNSEETIQFPTWKISCRRVK